MRLNKAYIERRFERIATLLQWNTGAAWRRDEQGNNRAIIGATFIENVPIYGGWQINQIANEGGGQNTLLPRRMKAAELDAWFSGVEFGFDAARRV